MLFTEEIITNSLFSHDAVVSVSKEKTKPMLGSDIKVTERRSLPDILAGALRHSSR